MNDENKTLEELENELKHSVKYDETKEKYGRDDLIPLWIADMDFKARHVIESYGETEVKIEKRLADKDARRRVFYRSFSMREWGALENYHLMLDSGTVGFEECADIIARIARAD